MTENNNITLTNTEAKEILRLLEFSQFSLLSDKDSETLDFKLSANRLRDAIAKCEEK